jgi:rhodanese-related sulfurtransferase
LAELPKDRDVVVFCASGSRSGMAKMMLKAKGFKQVHNAGTWGNVCDQ